MDRIQTKQWYETVFAAIMFILIMLVAGIADAKMVDKNPVLDKSVMATLGKCQKISLSCAATMKDAPGILVFPSVVKADLIIGGAGGKGALIENGRITGYYSIGAASAGLQVGIEDKSQVYVFRTPESLDQLKGGSDWKASASAGVTLIATDENASSATGSVLAYVFDAKGLNAGISLDLFDVWKTGQVRPSQQ